MKSLRRILLASLALAAFALPMAAPGCAAGFAPISQVKGLRVLAVVADAPYAQPGETVHFSITYADTYGRPPPSILWLGGCYDPPGDEYYLCYAPPDGGADGGSGPSGIPGAVVGFGPTFSLRLPGDLITRKCADGACASAGKNTPYGLAYVFFAACAGTIKQVPSEGTGLAGSFPLGCFDADGNRLGADSFVPGYTQVYAFPDSRTNTNPTVNGIDLGGAPLPAGACMPSAPACGDGGTAEPPEDAGPDGAPACCAVNACDVAEDTRLASAGCGKGDPFKTCAAQEYAISVDVPADVGDFDMSFPKTARLAAQKTVWVDYFADQGDFDNAVLLVNDGTQGLQPVSTYTANYIPPPLDADAGNAPIDVNIWAVVHDSQGGEAVVTRSLRVQ